MITLSRIGTVKSTLTIKEIPLSSLRIGPNNNTMKKVLLILPALLFAFGVILHAQAPVIKWQQSSVSGPPFVRYFEEDGYKWEEIEHIYHLLDKIVAGANGSYAGVDLAGKLFVKFDQLGNLTLKKPITGMDGITSLTKASDGGYILLGYNYVPRPGGGVLYPYLALVKVDESGNNVWTKTFKGATTPVVPRPTYRYDCIPGSIITTIDGGYLIGAASYADAGNEKSENGRGESDYWIIKIDAAGTKQWDKTFGGSKDDGGTSRPVSVAQASDGNYFIGGTSLSSASGDKSENSKTKADARDYWGDYWVVKISSSGNLLWEKTLGGDAADQLSAIAATTSGGCIVGGESSSAKSGDKTETSENLDLWIVKLSAAGAMEWQKTILNGAPEDVLKGEYQDDYMRSIAQAPGGGFLIGADKSMLTMEMGYSQIYWALKLSETGGLEWQKTLGGSPSNEHLANLIPLNDGHILAAGVSSSGVSGNKTLPKIDPGGGNEYWLLELMPCQNGSKNQKTICRGETYDFYGTPVTLPGIYKHTLTNQYGCDSVVEMTLGFYPFGNPAVTVQENVLSSATTHSSYQWLMDGKLLTGETNPSYTALLNGLYQLVVGTADNCYDTSLAVKPLFKPNIFVPTLFSPNGDGKNDVLKMYGNQLQSARLLIFNQWGQKLFEANDATQNGWDGNVGGKPQPTGVYMYVWEAILSNGQKETSKGSFTLVR